MAHWIVYDDESAAALKARTHAAVEIAAGKPVDVLLAAPQQAMALLPGGEGQTVVVTLRRPKAPAERRTATVATGFLGLQDEAVEENELLAEEAQTDSWWGRWWPGRRRQY